MIGPFLVLIAIFLFYVQIRGKSGDFLNALIQPLESRINQEQQTLQSDIGTWLGYHLYDQLTNAIIRAIPSININIAGQSISVTKPPEQKTNAQGSTGV